MEEIKVNDIYLETPHLDKIPQAYNIDNKPCNHQTKLKKTCNQTKLKKTYKQSCYEHCKRIKAIKNIKINISSMNVNQLELFIFKYNKFNKNIK